MQRKTLTEQLREANAQLALARTTIKQQGSVIATQHAQLIFHRQTERRFDQLLEAVSSGMREGNLPRRPHG